MSVDLVVALDELAKELRESLEIESKTVNDRKTLVEELKSKVNAKLELEMDPGYVIQKAYRDGAFRREPKIKEWNDWMSNMRRLFQENQKMRRNLMKEELRQVTNRNVSVENEWKRVVEERHSRSLVELVDKNLEPVFDLRYHAFCPEYFSSTQVLVNPPYVSRFLKVLQRTELSSMAIVLQAEMRRMERMLNEVLQMKHKALSELDLAMMRKRTPSKSQVMESSEYQDALAVLNKLKKRLDEEDECYANDAAALHTSIVETVHELRERVESFGTLNERFDMIRGKQRLATMQMKLMQYLRCIFSHSAMSLSTGLGQAFREWTQCVTKASEVLDRYLSTRDGRILESFLSELLAARNSIVSSSFFGHEKRNQNVQSLRLEHHDGRTTTHTVTDKRDNMASMVREAEQGNVERVGNSEALVDCSRKVLNCLSKIATHKPLSQRLSLLENSPAPDLDRRLERLSEINNMISNRKVLISKIQAEMEQIQKEVTSHDKSENSRKVCRKAPGIDATYTQIRMTLACEICDRQASVYVGGCGHMICEKCEQRARKSKATQCPVCGTICEFITIKY